jgi:hypothetical protein
MKTIGLIIFIIVLGFVGIMCLFFPVKVQEFAIKSVSQGYLTGNSFLESFVKSNKYLTVVKAVGFGAILMFCFLAWVSLRANL